MDLSIELTISNYDFIYNLCLSYYLRYFREQEPTKLIVGNIKTKNTFVLINSLQSVTSYPIHTSYNAAFAIILSISHNKSKIHSRRFKNKYCNIRLTAYFMGRRCDNSLKNSCI